MRTWTKIDKWRLARLKCQIRTLLRRLFYANICRAAKVQKEFGQSGSAWAEREVEGRRVVGFLPNNFRASFFFVLLMFWFVRACKCLHSEHLFLCALAVSFFFLSFPVPLHIHTFGMYICIFLYMYVSAVFSFFFAAQSNFLAVLLVIFATTANKLCSSKWKLCNVH